MSTVGDMLQIAAQWLPVWRDAVVAFLALVVIVCLWVYVSAVGEQ